MTTWRPDRLAVAYDNELLRRQLVDDHPTNPIRAKLAVSADLPAPLYKQDALIATSRRGRRPGG